jgi:hypothetical protein
MRPIAEWLPEIAVSEVEFARKHPHPFVVYWLGRGELKPAPKPLAMTIDRLVVDTPAPIVDDPQLENYLAAAVVPRDPARSLDVTIGCTDDCDIQVEDASVSRLHAYLVPDADGWRVRDASSTAGTYVNDARPSDGYLLMSGDRITIAYVDLVFLTARGFYVFLRRLELLSEG